MSYENSEVIPGYLGYSIDPEGNVYSEMKVHDVRRMTMYTRGDNTNGPFVMLVVDGLKKTVYITELLRIAFPMMTDEEISYWKEPVLPKHRHDILPWRKA